MWREIYLRSFTILISRLSLNVTNSIFINWEILRKYILNHRDIELGKIRNVRLITGLDRYIDTMVWIY